MSLPQTAVQAQDADDLARRVAEIMFQTDISARVTMGITMGEVREGYAVCQMHVRELHLNGHRVCHGGFVFTLADTAFAYACNSRNKTTLAASAMIDFLKPSHEGDVLTAHAQEQWTEGRHGVYNITVRNQRGEVVALFRGKSAQIPGSVVPE
jgi:acyl-CoA thioesterase